MLYVANAGDCQAILGRKGPEGQLKRVALSQPHTPILLKEKERIRKAGE